MVFLVYIKFVYLSSINYVVQFYFIMVLECYVYIGLKENNNQIQKVQGLQLTSKIAENILSEDQGPFCSKENLKVFLAEGCISDTHRRSDKPSLCKRRDIHC